MDLPEKLRILRSNRRLRQSDIAAILHISVDAYQKWETAKNSVPLEFLLALANYYELTTDFLLDDSKVLYDFSEPVLLYNDYPPCKQIFNDTNPSVYDAGLKGGALLYRCVNEGGCEYSCIIYRNLDVLSCPREKEKDMIRFWNYESTIPDLF